MPQVGSNNQAAAQQLAYAVVRPSTVNAELVAPDGSARPVDAGTREAGTYRFCVDAFDVEGTWRWRITATDDQNRQSVAERPFLVDYTLSALKVPGVAHELKVGFTLSRPASVVLQIETKDGAVVATLPPVSLQAGTPVAAMGRHDDERREGAAGLVRGAGDRDELGGDVRASPRPSRCGVSRFGGAARRPWLGCASCG